MAALLILSGPSTLCLPAVKAQTGGELPEPGKREDRPALACSGTEPFWSLHVDDGQAVFSRPGESGIVRSRWQADELQSSYDFSLGIRLEDEASQSTSWAIVRPHPQQACSDGMSDKLYPFDITLITPDGEVLNGCCL